MLRAADVGYSSSRYHGLSDEELSATLQSLVARGELLALTDDGEETFCPTAQQLHAAVIENSKAAHLALGLTPAGGARWEALFRPDWSTFAFLGWQGSDTEAWEVLGQTREAIESYLERCGMTPDRLVAPPEWEALAPYELTYWKTVPTGWCCRFFVRTEEAEAIECWSSRVLLPDPDIVLEPLPTSPPVDWFAPL